MIFKTLTCSHFVPLFFFFFNPQSGPCISSTEDWGVNYRALNDLFEISESRKNSILYEVGVQMVEIYNEQVRDLLSSDGPQRRYPLLIGLTHSSLILRFSTLDLFLAG